MIKCNLQLGYLPPSNLGLYVVGQAIILEITAFSVLITIYHGKRATFRTTYFYSLESSYLNFCSMLGTLSLRLTSHP